MSHIGVFDLTGLAGVFLAVYAYARIQWQRDYVRTLTYSVLNLMSSILLAISLSVKWNMPAFVFCMLWGAISLYGVYRCLNYLRRAQMMIPRQ